MTFLIIFMTLFGITCGVIAIGKNRNGVGWFIAGFFLGIFAVAMIIGLPKLDKQEVTDEDVNAFIGKWGYRQFDKNGQIIPKGESS